MKVVLTGATGQLGKEIIKQIPKGFDLIPLGRDKLDLSSYDDCCQYIKIEKPDWIINAGAYTSVDKAEYEKEEALKIKTFCSKSIFRKFKSLWR